MDRATAHAKAVKLNDLGEHLKQICKVIDLMVGEECSLRHDTCKHDISRNDMIHYVISNENPLWESIKSTAVDF